jgi:hypothetical protein
VILRPAWATSKKKKKERKKERERGWEKGRKKGRKKRRKKRERKKNSEKLPGSGGGTRDGGSEEQTKPTFTMGSFFFFLNLNHKLEGSYAHSTERKAEVRGWRPTNSIRGKTWSGTGCWAL